MQALIKKYKFHLNNKDFLISSLVALSFLAASLVINFYAGQYATEQANNSVTDLILSNIPTFDVDGIFVYGTLVFWIFILSLCLAEPKNIPFTVKSIALFVLVRSLFITLTHIGPFPTQIFIDSVLINKFSFNGDLFFSGHVGLPFLLSLIFWENIRLRYLFIATSFFFGTVVLLGHLHYSIDVLSAFFITYTIFHIAQKIFKKDRVLFLAE